MKAAWAVFRKELIEALRDRRTVVLGLLTPVIVMPVITLTLPYLAVKEETRLEDAPARVAVTGGGAIQEFLNDAEGREAIRAVEMADARQALRHGDVDAVLEVEDQGDRVHIRILYDQTSIASTLARQKVTEALARFGLERIRLRLSQEGIDVLELTDFEVEHVPLRPGEEEARGQLAAVLPFFMAIWMVLGGQYAALDLGAGERERGTLPGLLLTPASRLAIMGGKFGAVLLLTVASVVLVVAAVLASLRLGAPLLAEGLPPSLSVQVAGALIVAGLPLAAALAAAQLLLSVTARSVREAQLLFTPLYLAVVASVVLAQLLPEWGRRLWVYAVPVLNGGYMLRGIMLQTIGRKEIGLGVVALIGLTMISLMAGAWTYKRERTVSTM